MTGTVAPNDTARSRGQRILAPSATIAGLSAATVALHFRDPHDKGSWGLCPSAALGFYCPGCGGLRAVNDLTNGDVGAALSSNLLVTLLIPVATVALALWFVRRWQGTSKPHDPVLVTRLATVGIAIGIAFAIVRNLAFGAWLAP